MAVHPSAIKRHRQSLKRRARNRDTKSRIRTLMKKAKQAIEMKDQEAVSVQLRQANRALDKAVSKGILTRNTASRWFSRLSQLANRSAAGS
ncbi:MAG: 30S ribosomal protein S20 [Deltaproteobacteria bacterium RIFCSPLOWO2_12_FULL_57_22]|nr:MAG: 30S ribosomal protein S20 [Deltaproteobacteria bacterium RIFCSPLOWO2_12_FULL_57_22]